MSRAARKKRMWRRIRRGCYVAAGLLIVVPMIAFLVGYVTMDPPSPEAVAAQQDQTVFIKYSNNSELTRISPSDGGNRVLVKDLDRQVPMQMQNATVGAEDATFWSNNGFDVEGIGRAVFKHLTGGGGGGSTLSQQYIKLATGHDQHTYWRKFKELVLSYKMNNEQSKKDIMRAYLNTAYYGRGANGVIAAAKAYFGKDPNQLTVSESAVLAGMVQQPYGNDPRVHPQEAKQRWDYVMQQMVDHHLISKQQYDQRQFPQTLPRDAARPDKLTGPRANIRNQVLEELKQHGYDEQSLQQHGYSVVTSIDENAQNMAENAVRKETKNQPDNLHPALVATDPKTGGIKAYYGGENVGFDYASAPQQPGSSFKPFVALAGLEQGKGIGLHYDGSSPQTIAGTKFANAGGVECKDCGVREAMTRSINTVFVHMAKDFGPQKVADAAHQAGIPQQLNGKPTLRAPNGAPPDAGIALGQYRVRTMDMAGAFGTFANHGMRIKPHMVKAVLDSQGNVVQNFNSQPTPAFDPSDSKHNANLAANVIETLKKVAKHSHVPLAGNRPVAAKTGTHQYLDTNDNSKAWMIGFTPQISTAVSLSASDPGSSKELPVRNKRGKPVYGKDIPGEIWQQFMNNYLKGKPVEHFPKASPIGQYKEKPNYTPPPPPPPKETQPSEPPTPSTTPPSTSSSAPPSSTSSSRSSRPSMPNCPKWLCSGSGGSDDDGGSDGSGGGSHHSPGSGGAGGGASPTMPSRSSHEYG